MDQANWQKAKDIFNSALEHAPEFRAEFLSNACDGDDELRRLVDELLSSYNTDFLESAVGGSLLAVADSRQIGDRIGRYEVIRLLGIGGMGEVYLAKDNQLDRKVAIKVLNQKYESNEANLKRFIQEAKAASALNHPNILTIHEIGEAENSRYIVSEFIDGKTLREVIGSVKPTMSEIVDISVQIASALSAAHAARIIHRDIKPENIIVRDDGYVKVLDFGLAKLIPQQPSFLGLEEETVRQNQTAEGLILGTVSYMSPEQARGETVDGRTDIFSLGSVVYEMITGRTPFAGKSMPETFANLLNKEARPMSEFVAGVPDELQRSVSKMLRKEPDERYQTMKDPLVDLKDLRGQTPGRSDPISFAEHGQVTAVMERTKDDIARTTIESGRPMSWLRNKTILVLASVLLIATLTAGWYFRSAFSRKPQIRSLAVLPLENLSGDPGQDYFADGMTETLINNLSQIKALKVISRTSAMHYKGSRESLPDIALALGVDGIIEGSVQRSGDRVRVTAQLIPATADAPIWSRSYEREFSDVLKLESDVAQAITGEITVQLTPVEQNRLVETKNVDPKAHEAYLLAKFHAEKINEADLAKAIDYYDQAIQIQPDYAAAYAGLSQAWSDRGIWGAKSFAEVEKPTRDAAMRALELDPMNADAHLGMASLHMNFDYDWVAAESEARRALELDPGSTEGYETYAWILEVLGRFDEMREKMVIAEQMDPVSANVQSNFGRMLYRARDFAEAERHLKKAIDLDPGSSSVYGRLGDVYVAMGRLSDAESVLEQGREVKRLGVQSIRLGVVYALMGKKDEALAVLNNSPKPSAGDAARIYIALREPDKAFATLNKAFQDRDQLLVHIKVDPSFDPLHSDPRWPELLKKLNLSG